MRIARTRAKLPDFGMILPCTRSKEEPRVRTLPIF